MTKDEYLKFHKEFCERMGDITQRKNADYTGDDPDPFANFRAVEKLGICSAEVGFLVRMSDKFVRISNLANGRQPQVIDEKVADTLHDLANYCALFAAYLAGKSGCMSDGTKTPPGDAAEPRRLAVWFPYLIVDKAWEVRARSKFTGEEHVLDVCHSIEFAQTRLDAHRGDWPTWVLYIKEVAGAEYQKTS